MAGLGAPLLAALGLAVLVAPPTALSKTIRVTMVEDTTDGICPGKTCNMRAAWKVSDLNDTIMLTVNPVMTAFLGPLTSPPGWGTTYYNGTVTITGGPDGGDRAVVTGGSRFIAFDSFPFSWGRGAAGSWVVVRLVLKNLELTGFRYTSVASAYTSGMVVCVSTLSDWCNVNTESETKAPLEHPQKVAREPKRPLVEGKAGLLDVYEDTIFGNWSLLRANAMLEFSNVVIRNNSYDSVSTDNSYGSVVATHHNGGGVTPVIMHNTQLMNNTIFGVSSATGTAYGASGDGADAFMASDCRFTENNDLTTSTGGLITGLDGPTIGSIGPISISGCSFLNNKMGSTRGVVSGSFDYPHHVYIYDTSMVNNGANGQRSNNDAAAVIGAWIVMERLTIVLPPSVPTTATYSANDQYMAECDVIHSTGKQVTFQGYQVFNRNPVSDRIANGTTFGFGGFADCKQGAPWLPCFKGSKCTNAINSQGGVVGYRCAQ